MVLKAITKPHLPILQYTYILEYNTTSSTNVCSNVETSPFFLSGEKSQKFKIAKLVESFWPVATLKSNNLKIRDRRRGQRGRLFLRIMG